MNNIEAMKEISQINEKSIHQEPINSNTTTGDKEHLYLKLRQSFKTATTIDIIVSFLMESGVKLLLQDFHDAIDKNIPIRILTGNYLGITQPSALYLLKQEFGDQIELKFYNEQNRSFHPKAYIIHYEKNSDILI